MDEGYRTFDHTGDLGLEVWAETPERLHALAAIAVLAQVAEVREPTFEIRRELSLDGDDSSDLFVHWLNSALLEAELSNAIWCRATVVQVDERSLEAVLEGPRRDPLRHVFLREIKAVSHHHLALALVPPDCRCRLILDL